MLSETPFDLSIIASEEMLLVTLRFHTGADRDAIECHMFRIVEAFSLIERLSEKDLPDLLGERKRLSETQHSLTLRRRFSDPEYPQKFDAVFRRLNELHHDDGVYRIQ